MSLDDRNLDARAAISTWVVLGGFATFGFLLPVFVRVQGGVPVKLGFLSAWVFALVWIRSYRIIIEARTLTYRSLFAGTRTTNLDDITSAKTEIGPKGYPLGPTMRLMLNLNPSLNQAPIVINFKIFGRDDLNRLWGIVGMKGKPCLSYFGKETTQ
jgi:hypothetical protein